MSRKLRMKDELKRRALGAIIAHAFFRLESALTIALTIILIFLYPNPFPWWPAWGWLLLGVLGEALILYTSIRDEVTAQQVVADMFRQKFNPTELRTPKYRAQLEQALDYRRRIEESISKREESVLRDHLQNTMLGISDWIANIFRLAKRLDAYENDPILQRDRSALPKDIQRAQVRLRQETDEAVRQEINQVIASKQAQLQSFQELENVMEKAELQIENSLTALGTLYSQLLLLDAKEVDSARARGISQGIRDQVDALQNIVTAMDEVYGRTTTA